MLCKSSIIQARIDPHAVHIREDTSAASGLCCVRLAASAPTRVPTRQRSGTGRKARATRAGESQARRKITAVAPSMFMAIGVPRADSDLGLYCLADFGKTARHCACLRRLADKGHQARCAWIDRVCETDGQSLRLLCRRSRARRRCRQRSPFPDSSAAVHTACNVQIKFSALLARSAMHIAEHIHARRHHIVQADTTGCGHACGSNRRGLRAMIDTSHKRTFQQFGLCTAVGRSPLVISQIIWRKDTLPIRSSNGMPAKGDPSRGHVDDRGAPPMAHGVCITAHAISACFVCCIWAANRIGALRAP